MNKLNNVWAIADGNANVQELERIASVLGSSVTVVECEENAFFVNCIPAIIAEVEKANPDAVITAATKNGRLAAGMLAAKLDTLVLSDPKSVKVTENGISTGRLVYGGAAVKKESVSGTAVLCLGSGLLGDEPAEAEIRRVSVSACESGIKLTEKKCKESKEVDLGAAKRVVAAGRGILSEDNLAVLQEIANVLEAEIGCTRPVSEENGWLPVKRYIGVSGATVNPDIYLAVGISGQMQHMVGCNDSGLVFAVNKDKNAPIFKQCDYGIVGDVAAVLPAMLEKLK